MNVSLRSFNTLTLQLRRLVCCAAPIFLCGDFDIGQRKSFFSSSEVTA